MNKQVLFESFPKQDEFLEAVFSQKYNFILYGGAIRGGKTFAGLGALLLLCKAYPKSKWVIVRNTLQTLKLNTIPSFKKICPNSFIKSYNQDIQTVTFTNDSQIIFLGENYSDDKDLNRFKGLECNGFLFEEINECQEKTFYKAFERAGSQILDKMPKPLVLATCNPANNWVKETVYDKWKLNSLPDKWLYIPSKITDNPFIPEDYKESLKSMPPYEYEVFVNGNWDLQERTGSEFYKYFSLDKHVKPCNYEPSLPLHISWDENVNPYLPCGIFQLQGKEIRFIDLILGRNPNNTIKDVCKEFKFRYSGHKSGLFIYGDATSQKEDVKQEKGYNFFSIILNELKQFNPQKRVGLSNPSVVMRGQFINSILYNQFNGILFKIAPHLKYAIQDFTNTKEAADGTKAKINVKDAKSGVSYQEHGHISDCFIGETIVQTINGGKRIDCIIVGDLVLTRNGYKKVLKVWDRGIKNVNTYRVENIEVTCTSNHKFYTKEKGFIEVGQLTYWNTFCIFEENKICEKQLFIEKKSFIDTHYQKDLVNEDTFLDTLKLKENLKKLGFMFINFYAKLEKYLLVIMSTIKMATIQIMKSKILNVLQQKNIYLNTKQRAEKKVGYKFLTQKQGLRHLNGTSLSREEIGTENLQKKDVRKQLEKRFAIVVKKNTFLNPFLKQGFVRQNVKTELIPKNLEQKTQTTIKRRVYDIMVEGESEFFANGILVHNCTDYLICKAFSEDYAQFQNGGVTSFVRKMGSNAHSLKSRM